VLLAAVAAGEWLRRPAPVWVWLAVAAALATAVALRPLATWRAWSLLVAMFGLTVTLGLSQHQLSRIEEHWGGAGGERAARVDAAGARLAGDLHAAFHRAERLAEHAARLADGDRQRAFTALSREVVSGPEAGVAILESTGVPWAWAGRHRLAPLAEGDSIASRANGYYVTLEARRHSAGGRVAVGSVLIWAHPAVPDRQRSLAEIFRQRTEVGLAVFPSGTAPDSPDVFDYEEPTTAGPRLLFSVQPIPPEQGAAKELALSRGKRVVAWLLLAMLVVALACAGVPAERFLLLPAVLWLAARAPVGSALGLEPLFSPGTFFLPVLGVLSSSAGVLALTGALLSVVGIWLWRRALPRRRAGIVAAAVLLLLAPYFLGLLGDGITPPASGVPIGLWLTWQLTLVMAVSALIVCAAALLRGSRRPVRAMWTSAAGVAIAVGASVAGLFLWSPQGAWPDWYLFFWVPALVLVTLPAPRWAAVAGIAVVAGSLAGLVTWSAELSGRLEVAQRDVARLGAEADPLAVPLLERLADDAARAALPRSATELYTLWRSSAVGAQGYPAHLVLWSAAGDVIADLPLDSLDLPLPTLAGLARGLERSEPHRVVRLPRLPGMHYVLLAHAADGSTLTAAIGPRSRLVAPSRLGRLLQPRVRASSLYRLELSPAADALAPQSPGLSWRREGWQLRSERNLALAGGVREVRATVDLRGPVPVLVRGALVVLLDGLVLALLWGLAEFAAGARPRLPRLRTLARSFRVRLAFTLGAFFVLPAAGFAGWSFARLADEAERGRDLLITQTLRDAGVTAGGLLRAPESMVNEGLRELSRRIDADLALYAGGSLVATSSPILRDLGVVGELMDPAAFRTLALGGELEVTRDGAIPSLAERIGYRVVQPGSPGGLGVLATPQLAEDSSLAVRQLDLALVLLLATLVGAAAAVAGAQAAARTLSRPVSDLRRAAIAVGQGRPLPTHAHQPPLEFEPVFGAFERMADDVHASQAALEEARRRTSTVLATVATGVVALDPAGRVLIANPQAQDLFETELAEGTGFLSAIGAGWEPVRAAVRRYLEAPASAEATVELTVRGRRVTVQLAMLGPDPSGVVLALNDVTELSRAERVLAWGEMARQVAHEIKNPLTPMRLGMQHLRRVHRDRRDGFDEVLEDTAERILGEIDRLDTIARAFSRFAAPTTEQLPVDDVDLTGTVREVVQLYELAGEGTQVRLAAETGARGAARRDELKEVLVNLLENSRNAGARQITVSVAPGLISVADDGAGIPPELLPRIFEPRFSTTTSGSGLGLPIVRRLVESWGGTVEVESAAGGTTVTVRLA
jgi:two-component system nitrogen regulation sensor histidine kinase NtrY